MVHTPPYSRKIWQKLNLADWPQPARIKILVDLIWWIPEFDLATPRICLCVRAYDSIVDTEGEWLA
jgi:hypothetical protein